MSKTDIIIAGGGIGGTVLAALLVKGGRNVMIVERATGPPPFLRPELLWPPAMRILERIRPPGFWEQQCVRRAGGITIDRGGKRLPVFTSGHFARAGVQPFFEHPNNTRETLLSICGAEVHRGMEVMGLLHDGPRVCGIRARDLSTGIESEFTAELTVGDDGAASAVRSACGLTCDVKRFPVEFLAAAQPWPDGWDSDEARVFLPAKRLPAGMLAFGMMPLPGAQAACLGLVRAGGNDDGLADAYNQLMSRAATVPPASIGDAFPGSFKRIGRAWGLAPSYGVPGAVLIGDAIHPVSPAGGQGANMAIGDAAALARIILAGELDPAAELQRERLVAHKRGLRPTRLAARAFRLAAIPGVGWMLRGLIGLALSSNGVRIRTLRSLGSG